MPRRTNEFQRLIALIELAIARGNGLVRESHFLVDATGEQREVDIVIELRDPIHPVMVCIECVGTRRLANKEWVERMWGKHAHLPTDRLVLVSKAGFTRSAIEYAGRLTQPKVEAYSLRDAESLDWEASIRTIDTIRLEHHVAEPTRVTLIFSEATDESPRLKHFDVRSATLKRHGDGTVAVRLADFVDSLLQRIATSSEVAKQVGPDGTITITLEQQFKPGVYAEDQNGNRHDAVGVEIDADVKHRVSSPVQMADAAYGQVAVALGSGVSPMGHKIDIVAAEIRGSDPRLIFRVHRPAKTFNTRSEQS